MHAQKGVRQTLEHIPIIFCCTGPVRLEASFVALDWQGELLKLQAAVMSATSSCSAAVTGLVVV